MSVKFSALVWEYSASEGTDRLVMLALADFADDGGVCYPGVARIAKKCRVSERTVQRCFASLIEIGELAVKEKCGAKTNGGATNRFTLILGGDKLTGGDNHGEKVVTNRAKGGDTHVTLTVREPSVEPSGDTREELFPIDARERRELEKQIPFVTLFDTFTLHPLLAIPAFGEAWKTFVDDRNGRGKKISEVYAKRLLNLLIQRPDHAAPALTMMFEKQWTGLKWEWYNRELAKRISTYTPGIGPKPKAKVVDLAARSQARREKKTNIGPHDPDLF